MKKQFSVLLILLVFFVYGCTSAKEKEAPKTPVLPETTHLTLEKSGILLSVSPKLRPLAALNNNAKAGTEVSSIQVTVDNNTQDPVPVSPVFVSLESSNGEKYKYSPDLTRSFTGKASFKTISLPPGYRGGGLLIFELPKGIKIKNLLYDDAAGHNMRLQFPPKSEKV